MKRARGSSTQELLGAALNFPAEDLEGIASSHKSYEISI